MPSPVISTLGSVKRTFWEVWGEPAMTATGLYEPKDRTYGRSSIPFSPMEQRLYNNPDIKVWFGKAVMNNGKDFTWYQVWEDVEAQKRTGRKADMIFVHGTGVHGGTLASHSRRYLDAGFRVIVPDLPSHGYSTGLHVFQQKLAGYTEGLHSTLNDVARRDDLLDNKGVRRSKRDRRETFMLGLSFGGLVALRYGLDYPKSLRTDDSDEWEVPIDGIIAVGPMIGYAKSQVHISAPMEIAIRTFNYVLHLQRLEMIVPHKKVLDKDPKVYKTLVSEDKRSHQGAFRVGHLTSLHYGMIELKRRAKELKHPIFIQQGGQDRVVDFSDCIQFVRNVSSEDKRCVVYPVCQHVIYRKAKTEEEDLAGRVACIEDNVEWMCERSRASGVARQMSATSMASEVTVFDEGVPIHPLAMRETSATVMRDPLAMMSFTPVIPAKLPGTPSSRSGAFFDPNKPIPMYAESESDESDDGTHPLLATAHPETLPTLDRLARHRTYRERWSLHEQLRPYDIICEKA
ncbi:unnamed protein product [Parajaminaea phylloscopi]